MGGVDDYISDRPDDVQEVLQRVRELFREAVPGSGEKISYQMPTVTLDGQALLYYAGWKKHLGIYPVPFGDAAYEAVVGPYRAAKDTCRFPYKDGVPYDVITTIAREAVAQRSRP